MHGLLAQKTAATEELDMVELLDGTLSSKVEGTIQTSKERATKYCTKKLKKGKECIQDNY